MKNLMCALLLAVSLIGGTAKADSPLTMLKTRTWTGAQVGDRVRNDVFACFGQRGWLWAIDASSPKRTYAQPAWTPFRLHQGSFRTTVGFYADIQLSPLRDNASGLAGFASWKLAPSLSLRGPWYLGTAPNQGWKVLASVPDSQLAWRLSPKTELSFWFNATFKQGTKPLVVVGPELGYKFDRNWATRIRPIMQLSTGKAGGEGEVIYNF